MLTTWVAYAVAFIFAILVVRTLVETGKRVKAIKNQIGRLSLTFLKIENDIDAVHNALIAMTEDEDKKSILIKLRDRRKYQFQSIVENGTDAPEIMRGLEEPDIDDDPSYWSRNRRELFGFDQKE